MNTLQIYINNKLVDKPQDSDIGLRLQRFVYNDYNITQRGGDYSLSVVLPATKTNAQIFGPKDQFYQYRKFGETRDFEARIVESGQIVLEGTFRLTGVTRDGYKGDFAAMNVDWLRKLEGLRLTRLGYVNDQPTWTVPFTGMDDANSYNENYNSDIVFPDISYNNVPVTDYLFYSSSDVFGPDALDLPNDMPARNAFWSWRFGATFEDFPPAVKLKAIMDKIGHETGYSMKGEIFRQDQFNRLVLPYVGTGYSWNWATLATLNLDLIGNYRSYFTNLQVMAAERSALSDTYGVSNNFQVQVAGYECLLDDVNNRVDYVANFKKFGFGYDNNEYIVPVDGTYKITIRSTQLATVFYNSLRDPEWTNMGQGMPGRSWENQVLVIVREDQGGDYVVNPSWEKDLADYFAGVNDNFINNPSDVIAYMIPKQVPNLSTLPDRKMVLGSPLQNFDVEPVIISSSQSSTITGTNQRVLDSMGEMSIEIRLLKNERVRAFWYSPVNIVDGGFGTTGSAFSQMNQTGVNYFEIESSCGDVEIDVARNLPDITAKDFMTSFIRQFNLAYDIDEKTKSITFRYERNKDLNNRKALDVTEYIDASTIEFRPIDQPKELTIGYTNDEKDRLLTGMNNDCDSESRINLDYANITLRNDSIYADGINDIRTSFSATRFTPGRFETIDITSYSASWVSTYNDPDGNPFRQGLNVGNLGIAATHSWSIPSIQSKESFEQTRVGDLEYDWDYQLRLLYFVGVPHADQYFLTGAPGDLVLIMQTNFWKKPTVCTFAGENASLFGLGTYPSLRFDTRLYEELFNNQVEVWKNGYVLTAKIRMNTRLWAELKGTQRIVANGDVFRLMTIEDYDVSGDNLATITLLKLT